MNIVTTDLSNSVIQKTIRTRFDLSLHHCVLHLGLQKIDTESQFFQMICSSISLFLHNCYL